MMTQPLPPTFPPKDPDYLPALNRRQITCIEILARIWQYNRRNVYPTKWLAVSGGQPVNSRTRSNRYQMITMMTNLGLLEHDETKVDPNDKRQPRALVVTEKGKKELGYWSHATTVGGTDASPTTTITTD